MNIKLSAIIITRNEEERIGECIRSVSFADEIIVVDSGSIDKTIDIAKKHGAKVVEHKNGGFSGKRNRGAREAEGKWLLYVDADERVTPKLRQEILKRVQDDNFAAYAIPRKNILLGKEM